MRDIVGVTLRVIETAEYREPRDAISHDWVRLFSDYGIIPLLIPNVLPSFIEFVKEINLRAIFLSNGNNVNCLDSDEKSKVWQDVSSDRDNTEHKLINYAVSNRIPLLGICRGMQMINAYFGGAILRDLKDCCGASDMHAGTLHEIKFVDSNWKSKLHKDRAVANSYHRQAVSLSGLSSRLRPFALAENEIVEGLYHPDLPIIGIQWHPERPNSIPEVDRILIETCLRRRN